MRIAELLTEMEQGKAYSLEEREAENERFVRERMAENRREWAVKVAHELGLPAEDAMSLAAGQHKRTAALAAVRTMLEEDNRGVVLAGPYGVGKTYAAAYAWLQRTPGQSAHFVKAPDLRAAINPYGFEKREPIDLGAWLIVLDDLGAEVFDRNGDWKKSFFEFLDARLAHGKTIITTNLTATAIEARYGGREMSRLRSLCSFVKLPGQDMRKVLGGWK